MSEPYSHLTARGEFWRGVRGATSGAIGVSLWGMVLGVAMIKAGLTVPQALGMTLLVYSGAGQLVSLPLILAGAPVWVVAFTVLVVNLRFMIYSAAIAPYLTHIPVRLRVLLGATAGDLSANLFLQHVRHQPDRPHREWLYFGPSLLTYVTWLFASAAGMLLASNVPQNWGLDLAGTLVLTGLAIVAVDNAAVAAGALTAAVTAVLAGGLPLRLGLIAGILAGVGVALLVEVSRDPPESPEPPEQAHAE